MTARSDIDGKLLDEAIAWHFALESDDADWDAYEAWLTADPRHRLAMNEIALTDRIASERASDVAQLQAIQPVTIPSPSRRRWLAGAMAAAIAVTVGVSNFWHSDTIYSTQSQGRRIALGDGVNVDLAPSSRLIAKGSDPAKLELAEGEAYFDVAHDPKRMLEIQAGDASVTDIGTKFTVNVAAQTLIVAVADGHVSVIPDGGDATRVRAGQQLLARRGGTASRLTMIAANDVGSWRGGRLVYDHAPLSAVVADISRYSGKKISVDPAIADREFSGVLVIGDGSKMLATLAEIMALAYDEQGNSARLRPAASR